MPITSKWRLDKSCYVHISQIYKKYKKLLQKILKDVTKDLIKSYKRNNKALTKK
jgi:hypothetical protein